MELEIKEYKIQKVEVGTKRITLPTETQYYFESGSRRSIKVETLYDQPEPSLKFTVVSNKISECSINVYAVPVKIVESIYYSKHDAFKVGPTLKNLVDGFLNKRTEEQFTSDLKRALTLIS